MKIKINTKQILELTTLDKLFLKYWLPGDQGIEDWTVGAVVGKVNERKKGWFKEWQKKLMDDPNVDSIPANEEDFINLVIARPDYEDRVQRDAREEAEREARFDK